MNCGDGVDQLVAEHVDGLGEPLEDRAVPVAEDQLGAVPEGVVVVAFVVHGRHDLRPVVVVGVAAEVGEERQRLGDPGGRLVDRDVDRPPAHRPMRTSCAGQRRCRCGRRGSASSGTGGGPCRHGRRRWRTSRLRPPACGSCGQSLVGTAAHLGAKVSSSSVATRVERASLGMKGHLMGSNQHPGTDRHKAPRRTQVPGRRPADGRKCPVGGATDSGGASSSSANIATDSSTAAGAGGEAAHVHEAVDHAVVAARDHR